MPPEPFRIGVRDLGQARAALAWAAAGRHRIQLYGLDLALLGAGFWAAVEQLVARPIVLECGPEAGPVLEALRAGLRHLRFDVEGAQADALLALVRAHGGERILEAPDWCLEPVRSVPAQLAVFRLRQVTVPHRTVKDPADGRRWRATMGHEACDLHRK